MNLFQFLTQSYSLLRDIFRWACQETLSRFLFGGKGFLALAKTAAKIVLEKNHEFAPSLD